MKWIFGVEREKVLALSTGIAVPPGTVHQCAGSLKKKKKE